MTRRADPMKPVPIGLLAFVSFVISCTADAGSIQPTGTVGPNLPREDPASYPDLPIESDPPPIASQADAGADDAPPAPSFRAAPR
jgi:hypothetical protein